jgi:predicted outer membrane repeat protein
MPLVYVRVKHLLITGAIAALLTGTLWTVIAVASQSLPATLTVTNTNDSGPGSLRAVLTAARAGDTVQFSLPANSTILLTAGELSVNAPVAIDGSTAQSLTVSGNHASRVLSAAAPLTVRNLTIADGDAADAGGGIRASAELTLVNVTVVNNRAGEVGGGAFAAGSVTLIDSIFQNNSARVSGGGLRAQDTLAMTGSFFLGNTTSGLGGGAFALGSARIEGGSFQSNTAQSTGGGGIYAYSSLDITETVFLSNTVHGAGGGAFTEGMVKLNGGLFRGNHAAGFGGGLATYAAADLAGTQFVGNDAGSDGGGADIFGTATLSGVLFQDNRAVRSGGGLHAWTAHLTGTHFVSNRADYGGGAITQGAATLVAGRFQDNRADAGGGLYAERGLHLSATRFLGNQAGFWGGGLYVAESAAYRSTGDARVINSLFTRNMAAISGTAVYLGSTGHVQIYHTTIGAPLATTGSAVAAASGSLDVQNTLIVSHAIGLENSGGVVTQDYNLFYGNAADTWGDVAGGGHNPTGEPDFVNVLLDDYHLGAGSAAVDAGANLGVNGDFDGDLRPDGDGFDIGFDERSRSTIRVYLPLVDK